MDRAQPPTVVLCTNSIMMGGMEAHLTMLAAGLRRRLIPVTAIVPDYDVVQPLRDDLAQAGVDVQVLGSARNPLRVLGRLFDIARVVRQRRPCVLHLHNTGGNGGLLPMLAARLGGASAVLRTEHITPEYPVSLRQKLLVRLRDVFTSRVICVSQETLDEHVAVFHRRREKLVAIANGIRIEEFNFMPEDRVHSRKLLGAPEGSIVVGGLGRMVEERKGFDVFIDMAAELAQSHPRLHLVLVGEGAMRPQLEAYARERGVGEYIRFTGRIETLREALPGMDIFVSPSIYEGGPITVFEAMAARLPVVSTDIGAAREAIVDGVNGRLVARRDAHAMAQAVAELAADAALRRTMGDRARATVESSFSIDSMVERVIDTYAAAMGSDGGRWRLAAGEPAG